MTYFKLKT